ncbi:MAG: hypothetical protein DBY44_03480 [Veillonellaceae bacterium]|nr:MAG: hypothetical protein DBY44_03480 [Veillonellaceae bacterium]
MKKPETVILKEEGFISKGNHRACYHYPGRPDKCIKVILSEDGKRICARISMIIRLSSEASLLRISCSR